MAARPPQPRHVPPMRTCVGCGIRAVKSELLRVVAAGNQLVPDAPARLPGRGAYLHLSRGCLDRARRRRAFSRALRVGGAVGDDRVGDYLAAAGADPGASDTSTDRGTEQAGRMRDVRRQAPERAG